MVSDSTLQHVKELQRPFSQACENNKGPILSILTSAFSPCKQVLEIGSGTGQHAVHFAANLPKLKWQPSDVADNLPIVNTWLADYSGKNMLPARALDVEDLHWPSGFDAVFSANTAHIMPWQTTETMLRKVAEALPLYGVFALYGPFNYGGRFTSESNAQFDLWLKDRAPHQGIRDFEKVNGLAEAGGLVLICDHQMPANNRLLVWKKLKPGHRA